MKTVKKIFAGVIGVGIVAGAKVAITVISFLCKALAYLILYFGLEFLFMHLIASSFLYMFGCLKFDVSTANFQIFLLGVIISLASAVLLTIRHIIYNPITLYFRHRLRLKKSIKDKYASEEEVKKEAEEVPQQKIVYTQEIIHRYPIVYRSKNNDKVIIKEYIDFYDIYYEYGFNQMTKIDRKPKSIENIKQQENNQEKSRIS